MTHEVILSDGRRGVLTTEHAASSYGIPVLVVDGVAYGSGEAAGWRLTPVRVPKDLGLLLAARGAGYRVALPAEVEPRQSRAEAARRNGRSGGRPRAQATAPLPPLPEDLEERNALIRELHSKGVRQSVLARHSGLSRQRISVILYPPVQMDGEPPLSYEELLEGELSWGSGSDVREHPRAWTAEEDALVLLPLTSREIAQRIQSELGRTRTPGAVLKRRSILKR